jgi:hypothetical protein
MDCHVATLLAVTGTRHGEPEAKQARRWRGRPRPCLESIRIIVLVVNR